eukprot:scaffold604954_cov17-Prasinocladus_malaysianus.AAC.1
MHGYNVRIYGPTFPGNLPAPGGALTVASVAQALGQQMPALVSAASISARGVGISVQQRRHQLLSEWNAWAANQAHGARPTLQNCGPHEVL